MSSGGGVLAAGITNTIRSAERMHPDALVC